MCAAIRPAARVVALQGPAWTVRCRRTRGWRSGCIVARGACLCGRWRKRGGKVLRAESSTAVSALSVLPCALVPSRVRCGLATRLMRSWRACLSRPSVAALAPMPQRRGSSSSLGPTLARARAVGPSCGTPQLHATWRSCARAWSRAILPTGARASGSSTMSSRELPRGTGRASQASGRRPASLAPRCAGAGLAAPFARTTARLRAQVSLALRVAQRAAGGLAAPQTPMAMPGSAAVDG